MNTSPARTATRVLPRAPLGASGLNRNHVRRDEILGTATQRYIAGVKPFAGLCAERLGVLLEEGFLAPEARHRGGPSARQFLRFLQRWPAATAQGYAVSRRRADYGVVLEGLACDLRAVPRPFEDRCRVEFDLLCLSADEREDPADVLRLFAWWDGEARHADDED